MSKGKKSPYHVVQNQIVSLMLMAGFLLAATGLAQADFVFGPPENLGPVINGPLHDAGGTVSADGLSMLIARYVSWNTAPELLVAQRATLEDPWQDPVSYGAWADPPSMIRTLVDVMNGILAGSGPADELEVYFSGVLPNGYGSQDIWTMERGAIGAAWSPAVNLGPVVNTSYEEMGPALSPDGLELYFSGYSRDGARPGGFGAADLWVTTRPTREAAWGPPMNLGPAINSPAQDARVSLSTDGLVLLFDSARAEGYGSGDLYMMTRRMLADPWSPPMNLGPAINTSAFEESPAFSPDGSTLYWDSARPGGYGGHDLWQARLITIVDLNGDGRVGGEELLTMTESWGQDNSLCDIGPMPWGDGTVDIQDVVALAEYIGKDVDDPTLVGHWTLDETEGTVASDSAGENDGTVMGSPVWHPDAGMVDGALEFDGVGTFVVSDLAVKSADGPFSILAWVKGGQPGQVLISQQGGGDWLSINPADGTLATECAGRVNRPLFSEGVITDGKWHRIGITWDGTSRRLYMDSEEVATDSQDSLASSDGGLMFGAGKHLAAGSFFSGLIDDVRIYDRIVKP